MTASPADPGDRPDAAAGYTDIRSDAWMVRAAPSAWRPYLSLMRLDRPIGTWLLLIPCWWGLALSPAAADPARWPALLGYAALFAVGAVIMRGAGCTLNDILDRDIDAQVERTRGRPLASGQIGLPAAVAFFFALLAVGFAVLVQFNLPTILLGAASLAVVLPYPLMKRVTFWPQAVLGLAFNWGVLVGWTAAGGGFGAAFWPAILVYLSGVCWTIGYDTVYAHQDIKDDEAAGVKSTARLFGDRAKPIVAGFYGAQIALLLAGGWVAGLALWTFLPLVAVVAVLLARHLAAWRLYDQAVSLAHFKTHRLIGLTVLIALAAGRIFSGG